MWLMKDRLSQKSLKDLDESDEKRGFQKIYVNIWLLLTRTKLK